MVPSLSRAALPDTGGKADPLHGDREHFILAVGGAVAHRRERGGDFVCQSASKLDPRLEWAAEGGQGRIGKLTGRLGFLKTKAHD
jgi:hypothetical protein